VEGGHLGVRQACPLGGLRRSHNAPPMSFFKHTAPLKDSVGLILRFIKSVIKSVSVSIGTSAPTEKIISRKCNTHVKSRI
jgi:hypothetical protein